MKQTIIALALALALGNAYATGGNNGDGCHGNCPTTGGGTVTNTNNNNVTANGGKGGEGGSALAIGGGANVKNENTNINGQAQGQKQGQAQGQLQGQSQKATGGDASNKGIKQVTGVTLAQEFKEVKQAPGVAVGATTTTASCRVGVQGTVSVPGLGVGFGSAIKDEKCDKRALGLALIDAARVAQGLGAPVEYFGPIFEVGLEMLRDSAADAPEAQKQSSAPETLSYVQ